MAANRLPSHRSPSRLHGCRCGHRPCRHAAVPEPCGAACLPLPASRSRLSRRLIHRFDELCQSKIEDLQPSVRRDEEIAGFEVPVHHSLIVGRGQAFGQLHPQTRLHLTPEELVPGARLGQESGAFDRVEFAHPVAGLINLSAPLGVHALPPISASLEYPGPVYIRTAPFTRKHISDARVKPNATSPAIWKIPAEGGVAIQLTRGGLLQRRNHRRSVLPQ